MGVCAVGELTNVDKLDIGMVLDKDVIDDRTGAILIPKNTALTKTFINKLIIHRIQTVSVKEEVLPEGLQNDNLIDEYSKVEEKLDVLFKEIKEGKELESDEIISKMNDFVNQIVMERNILTQMRLLRKKDDYTFNHSLGVSILAITLGKWLNYSLEEIIDLSIAGLFHDIGKLMVPDEIIKKPGRLTTEECVEMKKHSLYSYKLLLETNKFSDDILLGVLQHHEKINGTGYPNGVKGEKIHRYARIIAICDIYHALTSNRIYKSKDSPLKVADYLRKESFNSLDPNMTQIFLKNISKFYVGNKVLLSDGSIGIIVYIHPQNRTKPIVQVDNRFIDFLQLQDIEILDIVI